MLCVKLPADLLAARLGDLDRLVCVAMVRAQRAVGHAGLLPALGVDPDRGGRPHRRLGRGGVGRGHDPAGPRLQPAGRGRVGDLARRMAAPGPRLHRQPPVRSRIGRRHGGRALGVSARYVQMLFAEAETTPSGYILRRRLDLAAERLRRASGGAA
ncbi:MAG: hypothetical protein WDM92_16475 [Caulobacteraceae bacterium]